VSDHVFAVMYLLGIKFQPRMSSPNDRRLYAFEAKGHYGSLTPFMGERLDRKLIEANWDDVQRVIDAFRNRVVAPSLILRKLGTTPRQGPLSLAMREIGRIETTIGRGVTVPPSVTLLRLPFYRKATAPAPTLSAQFTNGTSAAKLKSTARYRYADLTACKVVTGDDACGRSAGCRAGWCSRCPCGRHGGGEGIAWQCGSDVVSFDGVAGVGRRHADLDGGGTD
jgi:hypothetical protein